ncbi:aldehyde-activating protein [Aliikangiella sp. G2MR2-5]|uniref:GFA family protein n=1 Tax=Aliikangiella sp. G2MR2-5 TaxID=2788943 RepID=UPI0018AA5CA1|nr:aldehyde-activating protein [Aliikangiella sp. G2MR2-5]
MNNSGKKAAQTSISRELNHEYTGHCACHSVTLNVSLPQPIENFSPRACDCDFCTSRHIEYISHPDGKLYLKSSNPLQELRQGSNQACFLACPNCQDVIAATFKVNHMIIGSLNSQLLDERTKLKPAETVSPKQLNARDKVERWQALWLSVNTNS